MILIIIIIPIIAAILDSNNSSQDKIYGNSINIESLYKEESYFNCV